MASNSISEVYVVSRDHIFSNLLYGSIYEKNNIYKFKKLEAYIS